MLKPIEFKGQNVVYAENQDQYISLPGYRVPYSPQTREGNFVTCWKFSFRDRISILFGKKLFIEVLTYWNDLQPIKVTMDRSETKIPW